MPVADVNSIILEQARIGDADAFEELFRESHSLAMTVARGLDRRTADDIVSEAYGRVFSAIKVGNGPTDSFNAYLVCVIRSVHFDALRRKQRRVRPVPLAADLEPVAEGADGPASLEADEELAVAFASLPPAWRDALFLSEVEGMKPRHAYEEMGLPSANAFSTLRSRARTGLRDAYLLCVASKCCSRRAGHACGLPPEVCASTLAVLTRAVRDKQSVELSEDQRSHLSVCDACERLSLVSFV